MCSGTALNLHHMQFSETFFRCSAYTLVNCPNFTAQDLCHMQNGVDKFPRTVNCAEGSAVVLHIIGTLRSMEDYRNPEDIQ